MVSGCEFFQLADFFAEVVAGKFCQESAICPQVFNWHFSLSTKQKLNIFSNLGSSSPHPTSPPVWQKHAVGRSVNRSNPPRKSSKNEDRWQDDI
jgi:hypothetical protein